MATMADIFDKLSAGRPPIEKTNKQLQKIQHAQRLLDFLQRWSKPVVRARDIRIYGPRPRDRESAINAARILTEQGWLNPVQSRRYDSREWLIVRKPIIHPTVANVAD
jgi:hypothetical protein